MGIFSYHRFIFLLACIDRWKVYNRLVFACTVKTAVKVKHQCVSTSKTWHCCRASSFPTSFFVCVRRSNRTTLAFKTAIIGILSKVEANNSLFFLPLQTYEKEFAEFPFLFIFTIP